MNATTSRLPTSIFTLALIAGFLPLASMTARADSAAGYAPPARSPQSTVLNINGARSRVVSYADLNLSHLEGIRTLNSRIMSAVSSVCPRVESRDPRALIAERQCRTTAIADAKLQVQARVRTERLAAR